MTTVKDYIGRTIDLSAFTNVKEQGESLLTQQLAGTNNFGLICTGVQKVAQRAVIRLFTIRTSMTYEQSEGCDFLTDLMSGRFRTPVDVFASFAEAKADIIEQFDNEEATDDPAEERLADMELLDVQLSFDSLRLTVRIITEAGSSRQVILPIPVIV